jgi:ceramide glucosyltransferase
VISYLVVLRPLLWVAVLGTCTSTIFLGLIVAGALRFRRDARRAKRSQPRLRDLPLVSVLKPICGPEAHLKENLESFFRQDYPAYEILIAADEDDDPALEVAREVISRYPAIPCRILITGKSPWPNPPAYAFCRMTELAEHEILVTSDSDVEVAANYLQEVVAPLLDPKIGMVTCVYRGKNVMGFCSGMTALGMSVEMTAGVVVANLLEGISFGLGPTIAVKKEAVARIGGYAALGEYFANDYMIGKLIDKAGYRIVLSHHVIDHILSQRTLQKMWGSQLRWAKSTRYSRPKGHFGSGLTFAVPFGLLGFATAVVLGRPGLGVGLLGAGFLNRIIESWVAGWMVVRDPVALKKWWLYPIRDLLGFAVWAASYTSAPTVWRSSKYELRQDKIILREAAERTP